MIIIQFVLIVLFFLCFGNTTALFTTEMLAGFHFQRRFRGDLSDFQNNELSGFVQLFLAHVKRFSVHVTGEIQDVFWADDDDEGEETGRTQIQT